MGFFKNVFSDKDKKAEKSKTLSKSRPSVKAPAIPPVIPSEPIELPVTVTSAPPKTIKRPAPPKQTPSESAPIPADTTPALQRPHPIPLVFSEASTSSSSTLDSILTTNSSSTTITSPSSSLPSLPLKGSLGTFPQDARRAPQQQSSYTAYSRPPPPRPPKIRSSPLAPLPDNAPNFSKIAVTPHSTPPPHQQQQRQQQQYQQHQQHQQYQQQQQQQHNRGQMRRNSMPTPNQYYRGYPSPQQQQSDPNSHPYSGQRHSNSLSELPTAYNKSLAGSMRSSSTSSLTSLASTNCSITNTRRKSKDLPLALLPRSNASGEFSHLSILSGDPLGGSFHRYPTAITSAPSSPTSSRTDLNMAPEISRIRPLSQVQMPKPVRQQEGGKSRKRSSTMNKKFRGGFEPTIPEEGPGASRGARLGQQMRRMTIGGMDAMMAGANPNPDYPPNMPQEYGQNWQQQERRVAVN